MYTFFKDHKRHVSDIINGTCAFFLVLTLPTRLHAHAGSKFQTKLLYRTKRTRRSKSVVGSLKCRTSMYLSMCMANN